MSFFVILLALIHFSIWFGFSPSECFLFSLPPNFVSSANKIMLTFLTAMLYLWYKISRKNKKITIAYTEPWGILHFKFNLA